MTTATADQKARAALAIVQAIADTIREVGRIPSGHLYAQVMAHVSFNDYSGTIRLLSDAGLVRETAAHELVWIGGGR